MYETQEPGSPVPLPEMEDATLVEGQERMNTIQITVAPVRREALIETLQAELASTDTAATTVRRLLEILIEDLQAGRWADTTTHKSER